MVYPELAESLYLALADDPFYIQLEQVISRSDRDGREGMLHYYDYSVRIADESGLLTLPHDSSYWGAALWSLPVSEKTTLSQKKEEYYSNYLGREAYHHYQQVCDSMTHLTTPFINDTDWYLSIIGITTAMQGKGLGQQLIEPVLQQADKAGVDTYLETFVPRNIRFYQRYGYRTAAILHDPVMAADYHLLIRPVGG